MHVLKEKNCVGTPFLIPCLQVLLCDNIIPCTMVAGGVPNVEILINDLALDFIAKNDGKWPKIIPL